MDYSKKIYFCKSKPNLPKNWPEPYFTLKQTDSRFNPTARFHLESDQIMISPWNELKFDITSKNDPNLTLL